VQGCFASFPARSVSRLAVSANNNTLAVALCPDLFGAIVLVRNLDLEQLQVPVPVSLRHRNLFSLSPFHAKDSSLLKN
jgi:hypothetical protein